ncbi:hypothetical protein [Halalkalicoccus ordinarius]|uniref:hypothetical protein n=1 Tax=Halalkalicoccus ordinarius TaxID=3116651 RepID=UPI00300F4369
MLQITFVDADGEKGIVDTDLGLRYSGRFHEEIATCARRLAEGEGSPSPSVSTLQKFAIELYAECPLSEVELVEERRRG